MQEILFIRPNEYKHYLPLVANGLATSHPDIKVWQFPPYPVLPDENYNVFTRESDVINFIKSGRCKLIIGTARYFNIWGKKGKRDFITRLIYYYKYGFPFSKDRFNIGSTFLLFWKSFLKNIPIIILDMRDHSPVRKEDEALLDLCVLYYKREIPQDRFRLFENQDKHNPEWIKRTAGRLQKIRHLPMGIEDSRCRKIRDTRTGHRDYDIFWIGNESNSSLRSGLAERLRQICKRRNWRLFAPQDRISYDEFVKGMTGSKVCVSVQGGGWDCHRHYEILAAGSIPLMNRLTADNPAWSHAPALLFFRNDFEDFEERLEYLLNLSGEESAGLQAQLDGMLDDFLFSRLSSRIIESAGLIPRPQDKEI